jgi:cytochrome o ubiquinol oxidase subunit 1
MTGVLLSIPAADFELHNSLFLVAHFHNMIISGVLFGYFAGITYWFPKIFGFTLNEKIGIYAFWCWIIGFFVAFMPLYILGFMGATRRLDHYDASLGWQPLFIVAGVGVCIIGLGVLFQVLQIYVSIRDRKKNAAGPDPWNGRTLEWSVPSPAPAYNFAHIPHVYGLDPLWARKHATHQEPEPPYQDITLPKNTPVGMFIAACSFLAGFAIVWHMYWLVPLSLMGILAFLIMRNFDEDTAIKFPTHEIARIESQQPSIVL